MRKLYEAIRDELKTKIDRQNFYISVWNNHVERMRSDHPNHLDFLKPATLIEFIPGNATYQGNGVLTYENFKIRVHNVHEFFNGTETEVNLDVFDFRQDVHKILQNFVVKGTDYGTSLFCLEDSEADHDHDNIYHWIDTYTTSWTDNSTRQPVGGYEIDPVLALSLTADMKTEYNAPAVTCSASELDFTAASGLTQVKEVVVSSSNSDQPLILSSGNVNIQLSLDNSHYSTLLHLMPVNSKVIDTTVYIKYTANSNVNTFVNVGVPGSNTSITITGTIA